MLTNFDVTPSFLFTILLACNKLQPSKTQVDCSNYPCYNRGTCVPGSPDTCICPSGDVQPFCKISCQNIQVPCVNGGCFGEVCSCPANFAGPTCESAIFAYLSPLEITVTEGHVGQKAVTIQVCRQPSSVEVTLSVYTLTGPGSAAALPGFDFVNIPFNAGQDMVTISAGQTCTAVSILIISDLDQETMSKDFLLVLYDPQSSSMVNIVPDNFVTTITITDDDPDTERPTIHNCPDDITVTAPAGAAAAPVSWTLPIATDPSGAVTLTSSGNPGDSFTIGSTQVTYTATDGANNMVSCRFTVTVVDNTPPIISDCPSNAVLGAVTQDDDLVPISWTEPTATDISGTVTTMSSHHPGQQFSIGSTTVTYTFIDAAGNSDMCSFQVFVFQIIFQCPGTIMVNAGNLVSFNNPTCLQTTSNTQVSSSSCVPADGSTISSDTQVSCSCDSFLNIQCSFQVFVTGLPITIQCPNPIMVTFGSPLQYTTPSCINTNGNLGSSVTCSPSSGITPTNDIDVTCTCDSYQAFSCSFHVTVILQCPGTIMITAGSQVSFNNPTCFQTNNMPVSSSSCAPAVGSTISSDTQVSCSCNNFPNVQCSFEVFVTGLPITIQCPNPIMVTFGSPLQYTTPSCINTNGNLGSSVTCSHLPEFTPTNDIDVTCTCDSYQAYSCSFQVTVTGAQATIQCPDDLTVQFNSQLIYSNPTCISKVGSSTSQSSCSPVVGSPIMSDVEVTCTCNSYQNVQCSFMVTVEAYVDCPVSQLLYAGDRLSFTNPSCMFMGISSPSTCDPQSGFRVLSSSQHVTCTCDNYPDTQCTFQITTQRLPSISDPPIEVTRTTTSVTITWRPWNEETDVGDPPVVAYIPYYKMDLSQDWMSGSRIQADQALEYKASSLETDRNYTFSVAAVREGEGGEGPRGPAVTIKTLCIEVVPQMVTTTLTATNDVTVTWQQPTVQCSIGITQFTIYYEIEGDVSSRQEAGTADPNAETFTVDGSPLEPGTTYKIAVTVTTDQESALSEGSLVTRAGSGPPSSPVYLVALVIPVLLIIILLVVIIKRIRRKPATESKPVDVQDVDYVNAGVTDDPEDYIALEEQSRNTPAPKYQDLTEKEATTQVSGYERTILDTADVAPKAMPRQGLKRQTDYQYEDVNLGETDARKLPSVPQPDLQSEDDTEYEVPDMFEEYTGVHINTLGASKPITPRPMKITEYKTFMGRERSKVISEIAQQYMALKTGQQHPWTAAVKLQNKPKNFFKALLP